MDGEMRVITDCLMTALRAVTCDALPLPRPAYRVPEDANLRAAPAVELGLAARSMPRLVQLAKQKSGWEDAGMHGRCVHCKTRAVPGSKLLMVLGQRRIYAPAATLARLAAGIDHLPPLDPATLSVRTLRPPSAAAEGVYTSEIRLPWPLSNRQVVWSEAVETALGGGPEAAVCMVSTTHPQQGAPADTVLGEMLLGGFVFEPVSAAPSRQGSECCICSFLCHFDPKGSIPSPAANAAVGDHVAVLDALALAVEKECA